MSHEDKIELTRIGLKLFGFLALLTSLFVPKIEVHMIGIAVCVLYMLPTKVKP